MTENVAKQLELPALPSGPPKAMTARDLERLLQEAARNPSNVLAARNVALILFLRDTGCRLCGVAGLRVENLNLTTGRALV